MGGLCLLPNPAAGLQPGQLRHHNIQQDQVQLRMVLRHADGVPAVGRLDHLIASVAQQDAEELPDLRLIVRHQNDAAVGPLLCVHERPLPSRNGGAGPRMRRFLPISVFRCIIPDFALQGQSISAELRTNQILPSFPLPHRGKAARQGPSPARRAAAFSCSASALSPRCPAPGSPLHRPPPGCPPRRSR